jgi:hypothetical protein
MTDTVASADALQIQGRICALLGAPFSGALLAHAAEDCRAGGPTRALMAPWTEARVGSLGQTRVRRGGGGAQNTCPPVRC